MEADCAPPLWERPTTPYHAHFDCFSGAAGDMMLAACLDAAASPRLLPYIQHCLEHGLPELRGEFKLSTKRVLKSEMGSIAANYLTVESIYKHKPAPVPRQPAVEHAGKHSHEHHSHHWDKTDDGATTTQSEKSQHHDHSHAHAETLGGHSHSHHNHSHHHHHEGGPLRNLPQIRAMIQAASTTYIPNWVKEKSIEAFTLLAQAEAMTHGTTSIDSVHFHEVGAVDSIVDTVGTCLALWCLNVTTISCSRLPLGEGTVWTDHGLLPVPAPATLRLLIDMPTCPGPPGITGELVTPTAAALLKALTKATRTSTTTTIQGRPPCFTLSKVGIGAGTKDFVKHANILRLLIGDNVVTGGQRRKR